MNRRARQPEVLSSEGERIYWEIKHEEDDSSTNPKEKQAPLALLASSREEGGNQRNAQGQPRVRIDEVECVLDSVADQRDVEEREVRCRDQTTSQDVGLPHLSLE